jgi:hypothetical protein
MECSRAVRRQAASARPAQHYSRCAPAQVAFKNLPRLTFGNLQAKLFPIYFKVLTVSAATAMVIYAARHTGGVLRTKPSREAQYQLALLGGALVFTLANLLVLGARHVLGGPVS